MERFPDQGITNQLLHTHPYSNYRTSIDTPVVGDSHALCGGDLHHFPSYLDGNSNREKLELSVSRYIIVNCNYWSLTELSICPGRVRAGYLRGYNPRESKVRHL